MLLLKSVSRRFPLTDITCQPRRQVTPLKSISASIAVISGYSLKQQAASPTELKTKSLHQADLSVLSVKAGLLRIKLF